MSTKVSPNTTGRSPTVTSAAIAGAEITAQPEFVTFAGARTLFGIPRSTLYQLESERRIRFVRLRKPGRVTGRVLVDCTSVRAYLTQCAEENK